MKKCVFSVAIGCAFVVTGCAPLDQNVGAYSSMSEEFGKAMVFNVAHLVNNPERLKTPAETGPINSQVAVGPIDRYQKGQVRDIDNDLGTAQSGIGK